MDPISLLQALLVIVPVIIATTLLVTEAIKQAFKIETPWVNHLISWLLPVLISVAFVAIGRYTFGYGGWDYLVAVVLGLIAGAASNGIFDWPAVARLIEVIIEIFGNALKRLVGK